MSIEKSEEQRPGEEKDKVTSSEASKVDNEKERKELLDLKKQLQEELEKVKQINGEKSTNEAPASAQDLVKMFAEALREKDKNALGEQYIDGRSRLLDSSEVDKKDVLKHPVTFISHRVAYVITDDKKNGRPVFTPFREPIFFKYNGTKKVNRGKETELFNFSIYVCNSKKERDWLLNHSLFGIMFFANLEGGENVDGKKANRLAQQTRALQSLGQHELLRMARDYGISISTSDPSVLRSQIAYKAVEQMEDKESQITKNIVHQNAAEALFDKK